MTRDIDSDDLPVWKVTHAKNNVETVYIVSAGTNHDARRVVSNMLFETTIERMLPVCDPNDFKQRNEISKKLGTFSVIRFSAYEPYKLYSFNIKTGAMT